ncbi:hypothetical protein [Endozoicomonas sp. ALC066]|uniref:hypothetical protein n=1 Tax=Endozoicomonas sp. ALC066 TaxID=3403078 RepID=UPI003BB6303B
MSKNKGRKRNTRIAPVTWAQSVRDITVSSINRGQLPILGVIGLLILVLWRMPPEDVSKLMFQVIEHLTDGGLMGYVLSFILAFGWFYHAKKMRTKFSTECRRIGKEKSDLQSSLAGVKFNSSDSA